MCEKYNNKANAALIRAAFVIYADYFKGTHLKSVTVISFTNSPLLVTVIPIGNSEFAQYRTRVTT